MVRVWTGSGRLAPNLDGVVCEWPVSEYVVRDGGGVIVGAGVVGSRGEVVRGPGGVYRCGVEFVVEGLPAADFYEVEVRVGGLVVSEVVRGDQVGGGVVLEVSPTR